MKKTTFIYATIAMMAVAASCDNGSKDDQPKENPNPTTISSVYTVKTDIAVDPDGFNMLTDGGFENFIGDPEWKGRSLWFLPEWVSEADSAHAGARTLYIDGNTHDWRDFAVQTACVKKNSNYTLTAEYFGAWEGLNVYFGLRGATPADVNTNSNQNAYSPKTLNAVWNQYSFSTNSGDATSLNAFIGGWCWDNLWCQLDNMRLIPTGSVNDTFMPKDAQVLSSTISNATFEDLTSVEKTVLWMESDGSISGILHNAKSAEKNYANVFVSGKLSDGSFKMTKIAEAGFGSENLIPTGGITVGSNKYAFFYDYAGYPAEDGDWTVNGSSMMVSADGGETWTETNVKFGAESNFAKASFCQKGDYIYVFGSAAGSATVRTFAARVTPANIEDPTKYVFWDGETWTAAEAVATAIFYGPTDCMSVIYNASKYTFMAIYRSRTSGQLVYRDAGLAEGEWTGEKLLIADPEGASLYAPQVIASDAGSITFIASVMKKN